MWNGTIPHDLFQVTWLQSRWSTARPYKSSDARGAEADSKLAWGARGSDGIVAGAAAPAGLVQLQSLHDQVHVLCLFACMGHDTSARRLLQLWAAAIFSSELTAFPLSPLCHDAALTQPSGPPNSLLLHCYRAYDHV